jgi:hypothetical protein
MKYIFWNVRGIDNPPSKLALQMLLREYKPDFCFISDPWMKFDNFPINWFTRLNLKLFSTNNRQNLSPNLWCFRSPHLNPSVIHSDMQQISFVINDSGIDVGFNVVYASSDYVQQKQLWHSLTVVQNSM